jgi:hypothetical protein
MLNNNIFYHGITRKIIVAFGSLFSDIRIARKNGDTIEQTIAVPIAYAPKEKWIVRIEQDPTLENHVYTTLPRLSFEITGMNYDAGRKTNRMNYITCGDGTTLTRTYAPVPYNIDVSLYCLTKTQEDALQIVEQILPYFTPEYTVSLRGVPESNIVMDVPIILESVNIQDDYDGDFNQRRFVTYTMNFTLKANFYGPVVNGKIITNTLVDVNNITNQANVADHVAQGNPATGNVTSDNWTENI